MDRRKFLQNMMSAAAAGLAPSFGAARQTGAPSPARVVVIGAGIVGCSLAWHLTRRGCQVTIIEANGPAARASGHSFAWINGGDAGQPAHYHQLRAYAMAEHRLMSHQLDWPVRWGGSLEWQADPAFDVGDQVRLMQQRGAKVRSVTATALRQIEPELIVPAATQLVFAERDGALDAGAATRRLFESSLQMGAKAMMPARVNGLQAHAGSYVVSTDMGPVEAELVVVAAGVGSSAIARMVGMELSQRPTPGLILATKPTAPTLRTVVYGPDVHLHQQNDGRIVIGEKSGPPETHTHSQALAQKPGEFPDSALASAHAARVLKMAKQQVPALAEAELEHIGIGWRPLPMDGLPVVGRAHAHPGLYFAVMHSGITLAPLIGRLAATEILDGVEVDLLSHYRLERFNAL